MAEKQIFRELGPQDVDRLEAQRKLISDMVFQVFEKELTRTKADLEMLQAFLDQQVFSPSHTYELQSLGVVFGDVIATELGLRWEIVTDEWGTDPTLRYKDSTIQVNALTIISKRVEDGEEMDLAITLEQLKESLERIKKDFGEE